MTSEELRTRLKKFAIRIIKLAENLPNTVSGQAISRQIIRSGTSLGANYRAACIGKSEKDFINKLKMVEEELDETLYWLELIEETNLVKKDLISDLKNENIKKACYWKATTKTMIEYAGRRITSLNYYVVLVEVGFMSRAAPSCAALAWGYPNSRPYGLVLEKRSYKICSI